MSEKEAWSDLPLSERMKVEIAMACCYWEEVATLEADVEALVRIVRAYEAWPYWEYGDLVAAKEALRPELRERIDCQTE